MCPQSKEEMPPNALKHGAYGAEMKRLEKLLKELSSKN